MRVPPSCTDESFTSGLYLALDQSPPPPRFKRSLLISDSDPSRSNMWSSLRMNNCDGWVSGKTAEFDKEFMADCWCCLDSGWCCWILRSGSRGFGRKSVSRISSPFREFFDDYFRTKSVLRSFLRSDKLPIAGVSADSAIKVWLSRVMLTIKSWEALSWSACRSF